MLQLPASIGGGEAPGAGGAAPASGVRPLRGTLQALLEGDPAALSGLYGELQALLLQLPPAQLAQVQQLVADGMALPQAASRLRAALPELSEFTTRMSFSGLLDRQLAVEVEGGVTDMPARLISPAVSIAALPAHLSVPGLAEQSDPFALSTPVGLHGVPPAQAVSVGSPASLAAQLLGMPVPQQVGTRAWEGAIAERVQWMVQGDQQFARLKLNPPQLGPLEVRVSVHQDQTSVAFVAQHAATREALEAALPRLRELFDQASLNLVDAHVSDGSAGSRHGAGEPAAGGSAMQLHGEGLPGEDEVLAGATTVTVSTRLLDLLV